MGKWIQGMVVGLLALSLGADATPSAPAGGAPGHPAADTRPTGSVHGNVTWAGNLDFSNPDLSRAVVFLSSSPQLDAPAGTLSAATVAQKNKAFVPNFVAIPMGTLVEFPNWDHISHNVFSRSAAAPAFDLDRYPYGQSKSRVFDKTGVVQVFCNIHPEMRCIIFVAPNPFFARVGADGRFRIERVPPGRYEISVWQERCGIQHAAVEIPASGAADVAFTLKEDRDEILANNPRRNGTHYGIDRGLGVKRERLDLPVVKDSHPAPTTEPCPDCK